MFVRRTPARLPMPESKTCISGHQKLANPTFVQPELEYATSILHPSQAYLTQKLEAIQNRATRFICSQYSPNTSVTALKQSLNLHSLESRRITSRICLLPAFCYRPKSRPLLKTTPPNLVPYQPQQRHSTAQAITPWSHLPDTIASCTDCQLFCEKLLNHVP